MLRNQILSYSDQDKRGKQLTKLLILVIICD